MMHLTCETSSYSLCSLSVWCINITQLFSIIHYALILDRLLTLQSCVSSKCNVARVVVIIVSLVDWSTNKIPSGEEVAPWHSTVYLGAVSCMVDHSSENSVVHGGWPQNVNGVQTPSHVFYQLFMLQRNTRGNMFYWLHSSSATSTTADSFL